MSSPEQTHTSPARRNPPEPAEESKDKTAPDSDRDQRRGAGEAKRDAPERREDSDGKDEPKKPPFYKRPVLMSVLVGVVLVVGIGALAWWVHARHFESTDDAFIDGHIVAISPRVSAIVKSVRVDDNWPVKAGDVLVELDPTDLQVVVDQMTAAVASARGKLEQAQTSLVASKAAVAQAEAELAVAQANAENAGRDFERYSALPDPARSRQQLDNAEAAKRSTAAQVRQASAKLKAAQAQVASSAKAVATAEADHERAEADLRQARVNLSYCAITAPEPGRITRKNVEPGTYVAVGQQLFAIVPRNVWVTANYKETQLRYMHPGQDVTVRVDAFPDLRLEARVDSIQNGTGSRFSLMPPENATGNYVKVVQRVPVKILFNAGQVREDGPLLAPGMSVEPRVKVR